MRRTNLRGANLTEADLVSVNLAGANLRGTILEGANMDQVFLKGTIYDSTTKVPDNFDFSEGHKDELREMDRLTMNGAYQGNVDTTIYGHLDGDKCYAYAYSYHNSQDNRETTLSQRTIIEKSSSPSVNGDYQFPNTNKDNEVTMHVSILEGDEYDEILVYRSMAQDNVDSARTADLYELFQVPNQADEDKEVVEMKDQVDDEDLVTLATTSLFITSGAKLSGKSLSKTDLTGADLGGADLSKADLRSAELSNSRLGRANLAESNLADTYLVEADLSGVDLTNGRLTRANMRHAEMSGAKPIGAEVVSVNLRGANLADVDFTDADLTNADLREADLTNAILVNANLSDADLTGAIVEEAQWELAASLANCKFPEPKTFFSKLFGRFKHEDKHEDDEEDI